MPFIKIKSRFIVAVSLLLVGSFATAAPSVSDNTISWPNDGWYQVQDQATYTEVCGGGRSCIVEPGTYVVINHSTGERFNDITVVGDDGPTNGVTVTNHTITWPDDGWYQVQDQATYTEVCGGGRFCIVEPGTYVVINHSTGERFNDITVFGDDRPTNGVTVTNNTISWPDDGWYQVQDQATYTEVCGGGRGCDVEPGTYVVINHSTGERFNDITVVGNDGPTNGLTETLPEPVQASLELVADKTFRISWQPSNAAQFYRVLENPDGVSGFEDISGELDPTTTDFDHRVALFARVNAQYLVQSCNTLGCVDSNMLIVTGTLADGIGYFKASNTGSFDNFGGAISLSADGNTLAVGASSEDSTAVGINADQNNDLVGQSGAVYVFVLSAGLWQQQAYVKANNTGNGDSFGAAVSLSADGNTLAVGAPGDDSASTGINGEQHGNSASGSGAVNVFVRSGVNWQQTAYIKPSNTQRNQFFGSVVSLSANGNTLAVGSQGENSAATGINGNENDFSATEAGAVYVFIRSSNIWQQQAYIKASNTEGFDRFGRAVSISADGNTLAVGADAEDSAATGINGDQIDNSAPGSGAVYVYIRAGELWRQHAYIKASTIEGNLFGRALSLSTDGSTLAVGAFLNDSSATGINGDQNDNSANDSGAVYVFVRGDDLWQQQAYIKASNTEEDDGFGMAVSLSADGNTLAVGTTREDSSATGINGDQNDNSAEDSGAIYVFARHGELWQQHAYVKASNNGFEDSFGGAVSLSADGKTLAAGAIDEDGAATGINGDQNSNSAPASGSVYLY